MINWNIKDILNFLKPAPISRPVFHFLSGGLVVLLIAGYAIMGMFLFSGVNILLPWIILSITLVIALLYTILCRLIDIHRYGWIVGVFFIGAAIFLAQKPFPEISIHLTLIYVFSLIATILSLSILSGTTENSDEVQEGLFHYRFFIQLLIICIVSGLTLSLTISDKSEESNSKVNDTALSGAININNLQNKVNYIPQQTNLNNKVSTGRKGGFGDTIRIITKNEDDSINTEVKNNQNQTISIETRDNQGIIISQTESSDNTHTIEESQNTEGSIDSTPTQESPYTINTKSTKTDDTTPRIMMRPGKVNQYVNPISGSWESDGDGESGAEIDHLLYCKKWYPGTIHTEPYKQETISTWKSGGNAGNYRGTRTSIACIQH